MNNYYYLLFNSRKILGPYSISNAIETKNMWEDSGIKTKLLREVDEKKERNV